MTSASCHVLDDDLKFLRFQFVMNKRVANALPNLYLSHSLAVPLHYSCILQLSAWDIFAKVQEINGTSKLFSKYFSKKIKTDVLCIRRYGLLRKVEKNDKKKQVLVILSSIKY